jgi:hypothetical protein
MRRITSYLASTATFAKANDEGSDKTITKMVYLKGDDTIKQVVYRAEAAALSTLEFVASMTLHLCARVYNPVVAERGTLKEAQAEILAAIKDHAQHKGRKEFGRAWTYRLLSSAVNMGRSLMSDYDKKGLTAGSPLETVLRSKSADKAVDTIVEHMTAKTKGANSVDALEKSFTIGKKPGAAAPVSRKGQGAGKASNNQKAATTAQTSKALMGAHAEEVIQAIPAKSAKDRANKLADKVGAANNVDHAAFVLRSLAFINDPEKLMAISDKCIELAKAIQAKANEKAETVKPDKAVAAQA